MSPAAFDESDELWMRLVWFTRLRWTLAPVLVVIARVIEAWVGWQFPLVPIAVLLGSALIANVGYAVLLRRWGRAPAQHAAGLRWMAHAQVLTDLGVEAAGMHFTGGGASPYWPFFALTVLAAALFFSRGLLLIAYGGVATLLFWAVTYLDGGMRAPGVLLLPLLLVMVGLIATFYSRRIGQAHQEHLELERLRTEKTAVEEVARRKDEILSKVSHELRNPLAALRGWVDLARQRRQGSLVAGQTLEQVLGRIDGQVLRMTRMVSDLYDLSSARAGHLRLETRPCDLVALLRELLERFAAIHPELRASIDAPQSLWGLWDPERLDQMITNLVGNAVKYATGSPVQLRITPSSGGSAHLEVIDHGPGIPPDKLPGIFEAFTRASGGRASGLGLGLSIAREIVLLHGGAIWVDSEVGRGTTFHVRLPTGALRLPS
jgi:signal transduction histidine kinase